MAEQRGKTRAKKLVAGHPIEVMINTIYQKIKGGGLPFGHWK